MANQKTALITGITGQDGSYLAELLLSKGYKVVGLVRRTSTNNLERLEKINLISKNKNNIEIVYGDLTDSPSLHRLLKTHQPDEVYNLAAQSHVKISFETPESTADITGMGVLRLLEAIRQQSPHSRFYQASSSEMFGKVVQTPQSEETPFYPRSPYGVSKLFGHWITKNYREAYQIHASNGILFNHESPRRGENFVTRKITLAVAHIANKTQSELKLGNLDAKRDWGHARDYVKAMWLMTQQPAGDDFVIGTGEMHSVREFLDIAFTRVGLDYQSFVKVDPAFFRPTEVELLCANPTKAQKILGWKPDTSFKQLVEEMVDFDLNYVQNEQEKK